MVPSLEEIDALIRDAVYQAVFLCDTARPATGEDSDRHAALVFDPKPQVLKELGLKDGNPFSPPPHRASLFAMTRLSAL
jgi:hypothetical protein